MWDSGQALRQPAAAQLTGTSSGFDAPVFDYDINQRKEILHFAQHDTVPLSEGVGHSPVARYAQRVIEQTLILVSVCQPGAELDREGRDHLDLQHPEPSRLQVLGQVDQRRL